jgi:hypothetical protein
MQEQQPFTLKCELSASFWNAVRQQVDTILDAGGDIDYAEGFEPHSRQFVFQGDKGSIEKLSAFIRRTTAH